MVSGKNNNSEDAHVKQNKSQRSSYSYRKKRGMFGDFFEERRLLIVV